MFQFGGIEIQSVGPDFSALFLRKSPESGNRLTSLKLIVAGVSKAIFIALVLWQGRRYLAYQPGLAVAIDSVMIGLFAWYLLAARRVRLPAAAVTS